MQYILFDSTDLKHLEVAILIKATGLNRIKLESNYIEPLDQPLNKFVAFDLSYDSPKKATAKHAKAYLAELLPEIEKLNIKTLLVADGTYFKYLTGAGKVDPFYGEIVPCTFPGYEALQIILIPNFQALVYNPMIQGKMDRSLKALKDHMAGTFKDPGKNILKKAIYPESQEQIKKMFDDLHQYPALTCDIESLSLEFWNCGISTIAFAWNKHEGTAFAIDRGPHADFARVCLRVFLETYQGYLIYHNASFDTKVLTYQLWMKDLADYPGMLDGINVLTRKFQDTKLIAYLATNNAVENILGLKELSAEYTGNYAEDTKDTSKIPLPDLLKYNLTDCLATWYVAEKYYPIMKQDGQEPLYENVMKPSVKSLLAMELCGMPVNPKKVQVAKKQLTSIIEAHTAFFKNDPHIKEYHYQLLEAKAANLTAKAKKKVYTVNDPTVLKDLEMFNPASDNQVRGLLYAYFGLPVVDLTKGKQPSTGSKTLKKLLNHTKDPDILDIIEHLRGVADASIILSTFIPALENAQQLPDGSWRVFGNFNLGGTQSLRLSSSNPNLQNLPSSSTYAKLIKECFEAPLGWLFGGSDFDSLEDKINALLTRDPNKLKVYTDGFDGHSLRALSYFDDQIKGIDPNDVAAVNSIKKAFKELRQDSKSPTFALTYGGTFITLMKNCGFSEEKAKKIEAKYHELYQVADAWVANLIEKAKEIGYIPMAFGGRIRTPLLAKTIGTGRTVPYGAKKEARSAGNAATQSYCVLTLRALNEFMPRVWASPYKYLIHASGTIHDAIYLLWPDSAEITHWINKNLLECMAWQDLPEIKHPTIRLSSALDIFWPNWSNGIGIPVGASKQEIKDTCKEGANKYRYIKQWQSKGMTAKEAEKQYTEMKKAA